MASIVMTISVRLRWRHALKRAWRCRVLAIVRAPLILLLEVLASAPSVATDVQLSAIRDPRPWNGYPENLGKPIISWSEDDLVVRYVTSENSGIVVSDKGASAVVSGSSLVLCYQTESVRFPVGQPVPSWIGPVLLEFTVTNTPQRAYDVVVSKDCQRPANE
jgi:hypothetical protein